jgi:hypothetical protein
VDPVQFIPFARGQAGLLTLGIDVRHILDRLVDDGCPETSTRFLVAIATVLAIGTH